MSRNAGVAVGLGLFFALALAATGCESGSGHSIAAAPPAAGGGGSGSGGAASGTGTVALAASATADTPPNGPARDIDFTYTLTHPGSAPTDVAIEYSTDGGGAWFPASPGSGGDGTTGLTTSPSGARHRFVWNAAGDVLATQQREVKLRVTPKAPAAGTPAATARFEVDGSALAAPLRLARYPYVQRVLGDSAVIVWRTDRASHGTVEWGLTPLLGNVAAPAQPSPRTHHEIEIAGISPPGSIVYYRVSGDGSPLGPGERFRAACGPSQPYKFAVFGDGGVGGNSQRRVTSQVAAYDPDFMIHTGDVVYPTGAQSDYGPNFFSPYRDILRRSPLFLSIGNHDILSSFGGPYVENFVLPANNPSGTEKYYSFVWGNSKLIALDTAIGFIVPGSPQHVWLIDELNKPRPDWLFVYFHHATHSTGSHGSNYPIRYLVGPLFERAGVDIVFTGHDHHYERSKPVRDFTSSGPGIVYYVTGGGGAGTRGVSGNKPWSAKVEQVHHFLGVEVTGRTLSVDAIRDDGTLIETFSLTK